jgi:hypothetical protein
MLQVNHEDKAQVNEKKECQEKGETRMWKNPQQARYNGQDGLYNERAPLAGCTAGSTNVK